MSALPISIVTKPLSKMLSPSSQPSRFPKEFVNSQLIVLSAQKRSAEHAISDLKSEYEERLSKIKREHQMLSVSHADLEKECSVCKSKIEALENERDMQRTETRAAEADRQSRLSEIIKTYSSSESLLNTEYTQLRGEQLSTRQELLQLEQEKSDLAFKVVKLEGQLVARSKHLGELQAFVEEKQKQLEEVDRLRQEAEDLATRNVCLQDRLRLAEQEVGHRQDTVTAAARGPCHLVRLELEHSRLKIAYKSLSRERADWLIAHEENEDLRRQVDQLKEWRQRALVAENALLEKETLLSNLAVFPAGGDSDRTPKPSSARLRQLQRENQLLLAAQGELRETIADLQSKLNHVSTSPSNRSASVTTLQPVYKSDAELILELRHQIASLQGQLNALASEKGKLSDKPEACEMKGLHDPKETRILTLTANPAAEVKESLYNETVLLRQQHERQRQRIKVLEECLARLREQQKHQQTQDSPERSSADVGVTRIVDDRLADQPDPLTELAQLREKLRTEVLRSDRLMELFQRATAKFRGACRDLLGYRIDIDPSDEYTVRSVAAAAHLDECVRFRRLNDHHYELIDSDYTQQLQPSVRAYLEENNSIPGFFASLTLTILQQATMLT